MRQSRSRSHPCRGWARFELALALAARLQAISPPRAGGRTPRVPPVRMLGAMIDLCADEIARANVPEDGRRPHPRGGRTRAALPRRRTALSGLDLLHGS